MNSKLKGLAIAAISAALLASVAVVPTAIASSAKDASVPGINWVNPKNCTEQFYAPGGTFTPGSNGSWRVTLKGEVTAVVSDTFTADFNGSFRTDYISFNDGWYTFFWKGSKNNRNVKGQEDFVIEGCPENTATPSPTATASPTPSVTPTNNPSPTPVPTGTPEPIVYNVYLPLATYNKYVPCSDRKVQFKYQNDVQVFDFHQLNDARVIPYKLLGLGQTVYHTMVDNMGVDQAYLAGPYPYIVLDPKVGHWEVKGTIGGSPNAGYLYIFTLIYNDCYHSIALTWDPPERGLVQKNMTADTSEEILIGKCYWYDRKTGKIFASKQAAENAVTAENR